jgi:hypothetical protein
MLQTPSDGHYQFVRELSGTYLWNGNNLKIMKAVYHIKSTVTGSVKLKRRKIAKALRWWLRENGFEFSYSYSCS